MGTMEPAPRVFSLEAVNAMVPRLRTLVGRQLGRRGEIETKIRALGEASGNVLPDQITPPDASDPEPVRTLKSELVARIAEYQDGWSEVEEMGAVLKDPRIGLLDFYGQVDGKLVWLCWKYGEESISHYHALNEGFSARKPIGSTVKRHLLN